MSKKIVVKQMPKNVGEGELEEFLSQVGVRNVVKIIRKPGLAIVEFRTELEATNAFKRLRGRIMKGKKLWVEKFVEKFSQQQQQSSQSTPTTKPQTQTPNPKKKNPQHKSEQESTNKIRATGYGIRNENEDWIMRTFESACGKISGMDVRHCQATITFEEPKSATLALKYEFYIQGRVRIEREMIQDQGKEEERLKREEERLASYRLIRELQQDEGEEEERLKRERERLNREEEERLTREAEAQRNERFIQDLAYADSQNDAFICPICTLAPEMKDADYDDFTAGADAFVIERCNHKICRDCAREHINSCVENSSFPVACPLNNCDVELQEREIESVLPEDMLKMFRKKQFEEGLGGLNMWHCITPDCPGMVEVDDQVTTLVCQICLKNVCVKCKIVCAHDHNCERYQEWRRNNDDADELFNNMADVKNCPNCNRPTTLVAGCNHITCKCGTHYCYQCLTILPNDRPYEHFRVTNCKLLP